MSQCAFPAAHGPSLGGCLPYAVSAAGNGTQKVHPFAVLMGCREPGQAGFRSGVIWEFGAESWSHRRLLPTFILLFFSPGKLRCSWGMGESPTVKGGFTVYLLSLPTCSLRLPSYSQCNPEQSPLPAPSIQLASPWIPMRWAAVEFRCFLSSRKSPSPEGSFPNFLLKCFPFDLVRWKKELPYLKRTGLERQGYKLVVDEFPLTLPQFEFVICIKIAEILH